MPTRTDDTTVADDELLLRRICDVPQWISEKNGSLRPSSAAFIDNHTNEVSVNVASLTTHAQTLNGYPDFGLVSIAAGVPRSLNHIVAATPEVQDPAHRVICSASKLTKGNRKAAARIMAEQAVWLLFPESHRI